MKKNENSKKPFFAKFLENQISKDEQNAIQGSGGTTSTISDTSQTMKYPSDSEDGPGNGTKPTLDILETMKYPSDSDESGTSI
ncbi:MAG: microviridin/marinostatin family tricyclic proteinase inhibitor [Flavobacterium sp.]|nr:microviridin/marinostatin family tricyclic proteinase inhibitor [Flavobacterium sp.]